MVTEEDCVEIYFSKHEKLSSCLSLLVGKILDNQLTAKEAKRLQFLRQVLICAKYFNIDHGPWAERLQCFTDLLLIDSAVATDTVFDRNFLTQAVYPWIRAVDHSPELNSALPFQLVTVFKFVEAEDLFAQKEDTEMFSDLEESKDLDDWVVESLQRHKSNRPYDRNVVISIGCNLLVQLIDKSTEGLPLHPCVNHHLKQTKVQQSKLQIAQIMNLIEKTIIPFYVKQESSLNQEESKSPDIKRVREKCMIAINIMHLVQAIRNSPTYCQIKGGQQIESNVLYRSNQLLELHAYLENAYWPSTQEDFHVKLAKNKLNAMVLIGKEELNRISADEDILALYC
jgi:hypothetical protein